MAFLWEIFTFNRKNKTGTRFFDDKHNILTSVTIVTRVNNPDDSKTPNDTEKSSKKRVFGNRPLSTTVCVISVRRKDDEKNEKENRHPYAKLIVLFKVRKVQRQLHTNL